jgi:hypothetical protein
MSAQNTVEKALTEPLARQEAEQSRFSRAAIPPRSRTVRITDESPHRDVEGRVFLVFSIDERRGRRHVLAKDALTGCVYPKSGEVFVKRGDSHYPARLLLGKTSKKAAAHVCVDVKPEVAQGGPPGLPPVAK